MSQQTSGGAKTGSAYEEEPRQYTIPALHPQSSRGQFSSTAQDDDESNQFFMSEPSLSELDDSSGRIEAPHRLLGSQPFRRVSTSESEGPDPNGMGSPYPVPPFARQSPVQTSPGNTSLSSWDSPATRHKVHLQFATPPKQRGKVHVEKTPNGSAVLKLQSVAQSEHVQPILPARDTSDDHKQQTSGDDNAPPLVPNIAAPRPKVDRTPSNSTSSASAGQLASIDDFLHDLRQQSAGALEESAPYNTSMDDSINNYGRTDQAGIDSVMRNNGQKTSSGTQQQRKKEMDTSSLPTSIHEMSRDDSMALSLSDSDNEETTTLDLNSPSDRPLDWEAQHSADDEKTAERPPRVRIPSPGKPAHRRTRSGDQAAATLVTGGSDWKGMGRDKIPLPELDDDDDDDTTEDVEVGKPGHRRTRSGDGAAASLLTGGPDWKGMDHDKIILPEEFAEEEDEEADVDGSGDSDRAVQPPARQAKLEEKEESPRIDQPEMEEEMLPSTRKVNGPYQGGHYASLPPNQPGTRVDQTGQWNSSYPQHLHVYDGRQSWTQQMPEPPRLAPSRDSLAYSQNTESRESSNGSYRDSLAMSTTSPGLHPQASEPLQKGTSEEADEDVNGDSEFSTSEDESDLPVNVQQNRLQFAQQGDFDLQDAERRLEDRGFRGSYQNVMRHRRSPGAHSPFANIGKASTEKAPRHAFLPEASVLTHDPDKYSTYICPRCKTRQREFFSVSDAPRHIGQAEGPSGYLALYFFIYVSASLFIFGLEEGWMPLDCIYFAVVTLTTSGLGDFVPTTNANKVICSIFIYFGVACIGLLLGSYIAGMLDDRAYRDAKKKQMESCPNCARIQTIREAAAKAKVPEQTPYAPSVPNPPRRGLKKFMSERNIDQRDHCAVYVSPHHHTNHRKSSSVASEHSSERLQDSIGFGGTLMTPTHNYGNGAVRRDLNAASHSTIGSHESSQSYQSQSHILGSPVTRQILGRQSHTRHASIDITNEDNIFAGPRANMRPRKYSEDLPSFQTPPTITEGAPLESNSAPTAPLYPVHNQGYGATEDTFDSADSESDSDSEDDYDESSTASSSSSGSSTEVPLDERTLKMRAAKYVLLTLRQALVNSMVIIAVGCMGFWFIEGFSLVDSWYFTTVFLTTVGYGDIVPVTKGGKLFATVYLLVAGTILINNMSLISMIPLELRKRRIERAVLTQFGDQLDDAALRELATGPVIQRLRLTANRPDGLDECTREMFALAMLVRLGKVSEDDIRETFASFRRLDVNDEGVLNSRSIIMGMYKKRRSEAEKLRTGSPMPPPPPLTAVDVSDQGPPFYLTPQPQHGMQQFAEEREGMEGYWFGGRGSLHVATPKHYYHFDPHANEDAALLQRQGSSGLQSSDSDAYSAYGRSRLHRQESPSYE